MSLHDEVRKLIEADILNRVDGAGSDLDSAYSYEDDTFVEVEGTLDVSALANTVIAFFETWEW